MDIEKIQQELERRFNKAKPEFYRRRIIFWYDEEKEFVEDISSIDLPGVKIITLAENNNFEVKKTLVHDDIVSDYLVYCPVSFADKENNWLLNVQLYSEEFKSDVVSIYLNEMNMADLGQTRELVKRYKSFFAKKENRQKLADFNKEKPITTKNDLALAMMASLCRIKEKIPAAIIKAVLSENLDMENNRIYALLKQYDLDGIFWDLCHQGTGYNEAEKSLENLALTIMLTCLCKNVAKEYFTGLEQFICIPHLSFCYSIVEEWIHSSDNQDIYKIARTLEENIQLSRRLEKLEIEDFSEAECFPCINEVIVKKIMGNIADNYINSKQINAVVEKRRTSVWYDEVRPFYNAVLQIANMQDFKSEHINSFHFSNSTELWNSYTKELYKMDNFYRFYNVAYLEGLNHSNNDLIDLSKHVTDIVEGLYSTWYLGNLAENWTKVAAAELSSTGQIPGIKQQTDFYKTNIKYEKQKVCVIISDAMRYEVGVSLKEHLESEKNACVKIDSMQGIFPTKTEFGMAALLPHKEMTVSFENGNTMVWLDGERSAANYRDKILKAEKPFSAAVKFSDLYTKKRDERRELLKDIEVLYIYHDTIDETSHTNDKEVFNACNKTIEEISKMVNIVTNELNFKNIFITSDHGFLYNARELKEDDKMEKSGFADKALELKHRYVIMPAGSKLDFMIPVLFLKGKTEYLAFAPKENIRIKNGKGANFVHGGISLQEMVVPLIEYYAGSGTSKSSFTKQNVKIQLLSGNRKIYNLLFSLDFYQTDAVDANHKAATYCVSFIDSNGTLVSDTQKIIADKVTNETADRYFRIQFNLKNIKFDKKSQYFLVIANTDDVKTEPERIPFTIDISCATDEFNFF